MTAKRVIKAGAATAIDFSAHPCFNREARLKSSRIHLPVAPKCNMQCKYCDRKFDCVNESRPGVTCLALSPQEALVYLASLEKELRGLSVVGIAGPGDPFANADKTLETLRLVREAYPELLLCVATNGLELPARIPDLAAIGVSHVTVTVNAVNPRIGKEIYQWIEVDGVRLSGLPAAEALWSRQKLSIQALKAFGVIVKVNCIVVPGVNDGHIDELASSVAALGADILNLMPLYPVSGTEFAKLEEPSAGTMLGLRERAGRHLPQMTHCMRCRADAAGLLGEPLELKRIKEAQGDARSACAASANAC